MKKEGNDILNYLIQELSSTAADVHIDSAWDQTAAEREVSFKGLSELLTQIFSLTSFNEFLSQVLAGEFKLCGVFAEDLDVWLFEFFERFNRYKQR